MIGTPVVERVGWGEKEVGREGGVSRRARQWGRVRRRGSKKWGKGLKMGEEFESGGRV